MKIAILTDSTAYISKEIRKQLQIYMIPLTVIFKGQTYREEIDITADEFYQKVKEKELPTTSQPPIGEFVTLFEKLSEQYDAIIAIHLSSGISGTFNSAIIAGNMVNDIEVYSFDSEISCLAQGFYAIEAAEMVSKGRSVEEIMVRLEEMKKSMRAYFMVDDLEHLKRGGRLNSAQALIGSLLQVKPILHFEDKKIVPFEKIRTRKKALNRIFELFDEDARLQVPMNAVIIHANRLEEAEQMRKELQEKYEHVNFTISYFGPVIGTHLGDGALALGWYKE